MRQNRTHTFGAIAILVCLAAGAQASSAYGDPPPATLPAGKLLSPAGQRSSAKTDGDYVYNTPLWELLAVAALVVGAFVFWDRRLAAEVKRRKKAEAELVRRDEIELQSRSRTATLEAELDERYRAQRAIADHAELLRTLINAIPNPVFYTDTQSRYTGCNRAFATLVGMSVEDIVGRRADDIWPAAEVAKFLEIDMALTGLGSRVDEEHECDFCASDGSRRSVLIYRALFHDACRAPAGIVGSIVDITDRKRNEQALRDARDQAEAANRAKDHFIAAASHELRTPLTPALLLVSSLENDPSLPPEAREDLATIREHIEIERRLIGDLLDFASIRSSKLSIHSVPLDLADVIHAAADTCRDAMAKGQLQFTVDLHSPHFHVSGDATRLRQVFWNLLQNSAKFTPAGGKVTLRTSVTAANQIAVEVSDTGLGIDAHTLGQLFTPFAQGPRDTRQHYGGLGLGLAIAKAITDLHGGTITASSDGPGTGSVFRVVLPIVSAPAASPAATPATQDTRRLCLLLVEDHVPTLTVLARVLANAGHTVHSATTVQQATALAAANRIDLVISDIALPDGSGLSLMPILRDRFGLRGIAMSGFGADADREASRSAGFIDHLVKPVNIHTLRNAIARATASTPAPSA